MKKTIFLINPPVPANKKIIRNTACASESKGNYHLQPYDFLLLSGIFPEEVEINYIDGLINTLSTHDIITLVQSSNYNIIITAIIDRLWEHDFDFLKTLREKFPSTPILIFGDALLEIHNCNLVLEFADGIIGSPLELDSKKILLATRNEILTNPGVFGLKDLKNPFLNINKKSQLKTIFTPRHELFLNQKYRFPFSTHKLYSTVNLTWGCPYSCSYCPASNLPAYYRDAIDVINELKKLIKLNVKEIYFADFSFGVPYLNTKKMLDLMISEKLNLSWSTYFHPNQFTEDFLKLMKQAGCHTIIIGIESFNILSLEKFGRKTNKEKTEKLIQVANNLKINICADFIFGLPGETKNDMLQTIKYACELDIDYASFNIAAPLPGSSIRKMALADHRMNENDHHFDTAGSGKILPSLTLASSELIALKKLATRLFYRRIGYLCRRLLRLRSFDHFMIQLEEMIQLLKKSS